MDSSIFSSSILPRQQGVSKSLHGEYFRLACGLTGNRSFRNIFAEGPRFGKKLNSRMRKQSFRENCVRKHTLIDLFAPK